MKRQIQKSIITLTSGQVALMGSVAPLYASTGWDLLREIEIKEELTETSYSAQKNFPAAMKDGIAQFDLTGYVVLLWSEGDISEFMLISDMGFCPFCGNPEHGTALQVQLQTPNTTVQDGQRITVRGALEPVYDPETSQAARLVEAKILN